VNNDEDELDARSLTPSLCFSPLPSLIISPYEAVNTLIISWRMDADDFDVTR
jgi:hypothetical protein